MELPSELTELWAAFAREDVRYLLIGGHAVSLHAKPRSTKDVDVLLDPAPENRERAVRALLRFGAPRTLVEPLRTAKLDEIVWLGRAPSRIDFLFSAPAIDFAAAWERRATIDSAGVNVQVIGREDLIANKRGVGRPRDRRDVAALERAARRTR